MPVQLTMLSALVTAMCNLAVAAFAGLKHCEIHVKSACSNAAENLEGLLSQALPCLTTPDLLCKCHFSSFQALAVVPFAYMQALLPAGQ